MLRIRRGDVVFDQDRDALERARPGGLIAIESGGDCERVRVHFAHRVEAHAGAIVGLDSSEVGAHQLGGSGLAGGQLLVQVANRRILDAHHSLPSCPCLHVQHEKRESGNN